MSATRRAARGLAAVAAFVALLAASVAAPAQDAGTAAAPARDAAPGAAPRGEPALRVFVVRHAQAWKNVPRAQRPPDLGEAQLDSLTDAGRARARAVGASLRGAGVARVIASPARRARQTAQAIADELGTGAIEVDPRFAPLRHGASAQAADWRWRTANWKAGRDPRPEGGESLADALERASAALDALARETPGATVVVVTHGEIAAALLSQAAGVPPVAGYAANFVGEGTISEVAIDAGGWKLVAKGRKP